jgi:hypothetical protein
MSDSPARTHSRNGANAEPDVYLSVPELEVEEIKLDVEDLQAHLALEARLANLLQLRAGVHVTVEKVQLEIKGVAARALLKVRLENVYAILDRALSTIDRNPQILEDVIHTVDDAIGPGGVVGETIESVGRTVESAASRGRRGRRGRRVTKLAAAAGLLSGAALATHGNGGIEKTLKELTG